jgi:hypothetical protein
MVHEENWQSQYEVGLLLFAAYGPIKGMYPGPFSTITDERMCSALDRVTRSVSGYLLSDLIPFLSIFDRCLIGDGLDIGIGGGA